MAKLIAPFTPFIAEELYRNLNAVTHHDPEESIHLASVPPVDTAAIESPLEERMERAEKIVMLVRAMRMKSNLKVRQPLKRIILPINGEHDREDVRRMEDVILDEINVKAIEYVTDDSGVVKKKAKANFKSIGPKFGKLAQKVAGKIKELQGPDIAELERSGSLTLGVDGTVCAITKDDVEIIREDIQGWLVESDGTLTVALDTELNDALIAEGSAREFVNRVQNMRKDAGFAVTDRINIYYRAAGPIRLHLTAMSSYIKNETLSTEFSDEYRAGEFASTLEINGETIDVGIERRAHV